MANAWSWTPDPSTGVAVHMVHANGLDFELAEAGEGDRLALCLHGFPELNFSWRYQIPLLRDLGYRVWAPNLRGYGRTSRPEGVAAYHIDHLLADVAALIDVSGARSITLIAHDWGAVIAWLFAIRRVHPLDRLVIMNVPHPACFARELRTWRQLARSWYVLFFQLPVIPDWWLAANHGAAVRRAIYSMAVDKSRFPPQVLDVYACAASLPGAATAMINYYRAAFREGSGAMNPRPGIVDVPTLMIWGEADTALDIATTYGTDAFVPDLTLRTLPGVSHWVQQEAPEEVNALLIGWLGRPT